MKKRIISVLMVIALLCGSLFGIQINASAESGAKPVEDFKFSAHEDYINYRAPLTNTYNKLTQDKKLNIVYFGGSVTAGYGSSKDCWRTLTEKWFISNFPDAKINQINAAIGESGTFLGTYRLQDDIITQKPDLLFIEYAINDYYKGSDKATAAKQYETIVREVKEALPQCDIVTLLVTDSSVVGRLFPAAAGHEEVSSFYDITTVNVGMSLWNTIGKTKDNWSAYFIDIVHPTDAGYELYYKCLEEYLKNALLCTDFTGCETKDTYMPGRLYSPNLLDGERTAYMGDKLSQAVVAENTKGFTYVSGQYFAGTSQVMHTGFYKATEGTDAEIEFKFTGTEFAMWTNFKRGSYYEYSIDGGEAVTCQGDEHAPAQVLTGIKAGEHTVKIKPVTYGTTDKTMQIHAIFTRDETKQTVRVMDAPDYAFDDNIIFEFGDIAGKAGDVNVDTEINTADLVNLKHALLGRIRLQSKVTADANVDGSVDVRDLVRLKKTLAE